jgi:streptogramin lyase
MRNYFHIGLTSSILGLATALTNATVVKTEAPVALTGTVTSQAEGAMEGVAVIAQRSDSTIMISVMTDAHGRYSFPMDRLGAGKYRVTIRAAGYVLPGADAIFATVTTRRTSRLDLKLDEATRDQLAHQLTNFEWWSSMPGTPAQKDLLIRRVVNRGFCHDMERVMRSTYSAEEWLPVIQRMATYGPDYSSGCGIGSATHCDGTSEMRKQVQWPPQPIKGLLYYNADAVPLAAYLATINLSGGKGTWDYPLKPMPRPKGRATHVIVTIFPSPRQPSVMHDLGVDSKGNVWYGDTGWGYLGKFDPRTGKFREWAAPDTQPQAPAGIPRLVGFQDVQVDTNDNVWVAPGGAKIAMFDTKTEQWTTYDVPASAWTFLTPFRAGDKQTVWTTGRATPSAPLLAYRLNFVAKKVDAFPIMVDEKTGADLSAPRRLSGNGATGWDSPYCYQIDRDLEDDFICNDALASKIILVDSRTGARTTYATPTPNVYPRRGRTDDDGRYWFTEFWGDRIGMLDLPKKTIKEFPVSPKYISPYGIITDKEGEIWASTNGSDRLLRINPATGEKTEYLMPIYYDARKVELDRSAAHTTIWLPNKNLSQLMRVEPLD